MSTRVTGDSDLARALQNVVSPKLAEVGWSSGMQDDTLTEYIILMLVNGKSQEQIATELANDLLALGPEDQSASEFAQWLFEQVEALNAQINGHPAPTTIQVHAQPEATVDAQDASMADADGSRPIPTGPKAMGAQKSGRIMNQINKAMDRTRESPLHRVRGNGRINSHSSREPPRGPRSSLQRSVAAMNGRGQQSMGMMAAAPFANMPGQMQSFSPQQQMQLMSMFEQSAAMMAQMAQQGSFPSGFNGQGAGRGKPLHERVEGGRGRGRGQQRGGHRPQNGHTNDGDTAMGGNDTENGGSQDPARTMCKFNLKCTKPDCSFAHQSPVAPMGTSVDTSIECDYGVACKNRKCTSRHPSPAKKWEHNKEQDCLYGPACTNESCQFKHPDMPPCRNGADCPEVENGCKFFHSRIPCKFTPCTNARCPYKHVEGQKAGVKAVGQNVWTKDINNHVSDRKFVTDEAAPEELILPNAEQNVQVDGDGDVVT